MNHPTYTHTTSTPCSFSAFCQHLNTLNVQNISESCCLIPPQHSLTHTHTHLAFSDCFILEIVCVRNSPSLISSSLPAVFPTTWCLIAWDEILSGASIIKSVNMLSKHPQGLGGMANEHWRAHIPSLFQMLIRCFVPLHFSPCLNVTFSNISDEICLSPAAGDATCFSASIASCAECLRHGPQCAWCFKEVGTCSKEFVWS